MKNLSFDYLKFMTTESNLLIIINYTINTVIINIVVIVKLLILM